MASDVKVLNKTAVIPPGYLAVNIMRPSIFGNPFYMKFETQRPKCIEKFRQYLWQQMKNKNNPLIKEMKKLVQTDQAIALVCCCKPAQCHGDVIKAAILWMRETKYFESTATKQKE